MNPAARRERQRLIIRRRLHGIAADEDLPSIPRRDMLRITTMLVDVLGSEGITDAELRIIYRLVLRGMLRQAGNSRT